MKHRHPLRGPARRHELHDAAPLLADTIAERLNAAAPRHPGHPCRVRDGQPYTVTRTATITLALALVDGMLRDGRIDAGDLLELVG